MDGEVFPIMPVDPFENWDSVLNQVLTAIPTFEYIETCQIDKWKVCCIPIKPECVNVDDPGHRKALKSGGELDTLFPMKIIAENIGSNKGLGRILRAHYEDKRQHQPGKCKKYTVFNVDMDIFQRMIKVHDIFLLCIV